MKVTFIQIILAGSVILVAIFWIRAVLFYSVIICTILVCSWLSGVLLHLQFSQGPAAVDGLPSVCDNKQSVLYGSLVRLFLLLPVLLVWYIMSVFVLILSSILILCVCLSDFVFMPILHSLYFYVALLLLLL